MNDARYGREVKEDERRRHSSFILEEALQEECTVRTSTYSTSSLVLMDMDSQFAMFRSLKVPTIMIIQISEIKSLEFSMEVEDEES